MLRELTGVTLGIVLGWLLSTLLRRLAGKRDEALLAILESTTDGILAVKADGKITACNQKFNQLWRMPEPLRTTNNDELVLGHVASQLSDPEAFCRKLRAPQAESDRGNEQILELKNGRLVAVHAEAHGVRDGKPGVV